MKRYKCPACGRAITVAGAGGQPPKMCCFCGNTELVEGKSKDMLCEQYTEELADVAEKMGKLYEEIEPLRKRYNFLMQYFRNLKSTGRMTEEEFRERAALWDRKDKPYGPRHT